MHLQEPAGVTIESASELNRALGGVDGADVECWVPVVSRKADVVVIPTLGRGVDLDVPRMGGRASWRRSRGGGSGRGLEGSGATQSGSMSQYLCHFCVDSHTWAVS